MTGRGHSAKKANSRGRPRVHNEAWKRVSVILFERHVAFLDALCASVAHRRADSVTRADVIRALIDALAKGRVENLPIASRADVESALGRIALTRRQRGI